MDLYKDALVKLYASAGFIYEKTKMEADMVAGYYSPYMGFQYLEYLGPFEEEYDGTAGIGHIGIEYFPGEWYLNAEIGYVGRIYKDDEFDGIDKAQAELSGTVGYYLPSNWRIDANVSYLTEAETLYIGGGVTFLF